MVLPSVALRSFYAGHMNRGWTHQCVSSVVPAADTQVSCAHVARENAAEAEQRGRAMRAPAVACLRIIFCERPLRT